jgi:lipoate-protein ligase A
MGMIVVKTLKDGSEILQENLTDGQERFAFVVIDQTEVGHGFDNDVDFEYCEKNGIPYHNHKRNGGAIVYSAGNIAIGFVYSNRKRGGFVMGRLLPDLSKYLAKKGLSIDMSANDILVDGYKVASASGYNFGENYHWTYEGIQISINQDLETIKNVCKKPMVKVPKGLSEYGITTEEMVEWCSKWLKDHLDIDVLP